MSSHHNKLGNVKDFSTELSDSTKPAEYSLLMKQFDVEVESLELNTIKECLLFLDYLDVKPRDVAENFTTFASTFEKVKLLLSTGTQARKLSLSVQILRELNLALSISPMGRKWKQTTATELEIRTRNAFPANAEGDGPNNEEREFAETEEQVEQKRPVIHAIRNLEVQSGAAPRTQNGVQTTTYALHAPQRRRIRPRPKPAPTEYLSKSSARSWYYAKDKNKRGANREWFRHRRANEVENKNRTARGSI